MSESCEANHGTDKYGNKLYCDWCDEIVALRHKIKILEKVVKK